MSKTTGLAEAKISVSVPVTGYRKRMLFTRFSLQRIEGHILAHFGLLDDSGILRDAFACAFTKQTLSDSKASLTAFLAKVGGPQSPPPKWSAPAGPTATDIATVINAGLSTDAELLLSAFAIGPAIAKAKTSDKPIEMDAIAMLRCDPDLLKSFIAELYASD